LIRIRTLLAVCALALPVPAVLAGCGGDDSGASDEDPATVLEQTFSNDETISSGDLSLTAGVEATGEQGGSLDASLNGPFQGDPENAQAIPQLDWTASASGEFAGQSLDFEGGLVISDDNAFVEYGGKTYEVGTDAFAQVADQLEKQAGAAASPTTSFSEGCKQALQQAGATDTSGCDISPIDWLTNLSNEGTEDVGGAESVHVHGDLDVERMLSDVGNLASAVPGASAQGFDPSQLGLLSGAISDASMDVYSGESDHLLRKLDVSVTLDLSAIAGESAAVDSVDIGFGIEINGVNEEQTIEAPTGAQPISDLFGDLGVDPGDLGAIPGLPGGAGGAGGAGGSDYLDCVQQAQTSAEINKCAAQL